MNKPLFYVAGTGESCHYAAKYLKAGGFSLADHLTPEITHLLLDIPTTDDPGRKELLRMLPETITVIGGNLDSVSFHPRKTVDLLKDTYYLASNAAITAECALLVASSHLKSTLCDSPALILGWGRIGKCLAKKLTALGCEVTIAARKETDRAMLEALGYRSADYSQISQTLRRCKILLNTVPSLHLQGDVLAAWKSGIAIDLASYPGMEGTGVIPARGLPGKYAPESSGKLIAATVSRIYKEGGL